MPSRRQLILLCFLVSTASRASAQGIGPDRDIGIQSQDGRLAVGLADLDAGTFTFPQRVFTRGLLPSSIFVDGPNGLDPGFFTLTENNPRLPGGLGGIPSGDVMWDFLPITIGSQQSNLLYWDGQDLLGDGFDVDDVQFNPSSGVEFEVDVDGGTGSGSGKTRVAGEETAVPGAIIGVGPSIHTHAFLELASTVTGEEVPEGLYVTAWQFRQTANDPSEQLLPSDPIFLALRTSTIDAQAEVVAAEWIADNIEALLADPAPPGDFNFDTVVNAADFVVFRDGAAAPGTDLEVFDLFATHFGAGVPQAGVAATSFAVPEPATLLGGAWAIAAAAMVRRRR